MKYRLALRTIPPMKSAIRLMLLTGWCSHALAGSKPNVIIILADDLGYGDVKCYNPERGKIPTPHIDKLASQGMRFTDAHTSSGVCSPTRYTLLTGRYHWRSHLQNGIVNYLEGPLIAPGRLTLASLLKQHGYVGAAELEEKGHFPSGPLRGYKADAWEGGHRVPFIVRWPGTVKPATRSDALVAQADLMATLAETLDAKLPANAGEDSVSLMPLLKGGDKPLREYAISHAMSGLPSLRKGSWKIIFGQKGGGFEGPPGTAATGQLYDLATDLGETKNLWQEQPELVAELAATMTRLVADGRSTPGEKQQNDVPVRWQRFLARSSPAN